jgi:hypothetical protein
MGWRHWLQSCSAVLKQSLLWKSRSTNEDLGFHYTIPYQRRNERFTFSRNMFYHQQEEIKLSLSHVCTVLFYLIDFTKITTLKKVVNHHCLILGFHKNSFIMSELRLFLLDFGFVFTSSLKLSNFHIFLHYLYFLIRSSC